MQSHATRIHVWLGALIMAIALLLCSACNPRSASSTSHNSSLTGTIDILTPSGSSMINSNQPLNSWSNVRDALVDSLKSQGFADTQISSSDSSSVDAQITQIHRIINTYKNQNDKNPHTLLFAPVHTLRNSATSAIDQRFGDTVTQPTYTDKELANNNISQEQRSQYAQANENLAEALKEAQDNGITVVLMAQKIPDFTEDYFVSFATAQSIARIQTDNLVKKLQLDKATQKNPQAIEIIIPANVGATFARELFSAAWKILKPYYSTGVAFSPSGLLEANSTDSDWRNVSVPNDSPETISSALRNRLSSSQSSSSAGTIVNVDGVLAFDDNIAQEVVTGLTNLGFTGSSAQINPSVTLDSIIKKLVDNVDVNKQRVPQPNDPDTDSDESSQDTQSSHSTNTQPNRTILTWPIITGFGTYINAIPDIVNGKIWISTSVERTRIVSSIATLSKAICQRKTTTVNLSKTVPYFNDKTITAPLFAVNSDNLKKTLLDTGYITPADAGL